MSYILGRIWGRKIGRERRPSSSSSFSRDGNSIRDWMLGGFGAVLARGLCGLFLLSWQLGAACGMSDMADFTGAFDIAVGWVNGRTESSRRVALLPFCFIPQLILLQRFLGVAAFIFRWMVASTKDALGWLLPTCSVGHGQMVSRASDALWRVITIRLCVTVLLASHTLDYFSSFMWFFYLYSVVSQVLEFKNDLQFFCILEVRLAKSDLSFW